VNAWRSQFFLQSQYDLWQQEHVLFDGVNNTAAMDQLGANISAHITALTVASPGAVVGGFIDSCNHHCATNGYWHAVALADGTTPARAFSQFWHSLDSSSSSDGAQDTTSKAQRLWRQTETYPCTACCGTTKGQVDVELPRIGGTGRLKLDDEQVSLFAHFLHFLYSNSLLYQDRLRTNIGNTQK
jgi:hypothetical protein